MLIVINPTYICKICFVVGNDCMLWNARLIKIIQLVTICSVRAESFRTADVHQTVTNSEREMHTTAPWLRGYVKAKQFKPKINCLGPCSALGTLVFARKSNSE